METGRDGVAVHDDRHDRQGRWMVVAMVAVLVALAASWAVFLFLL